MEYPHDGELLKNFSSVLVFTFDHGYSSMAIYDKPDGFPDSLAVDYDSTAQVMRMYGFVGGKKRDWFGNYAEDMEGFDLTGYLFHGKRIEVGITDMSGDGVPEVVVASGDAESSASFKVYAWGKGGRFHLAGGDIRLAPYRMENDTLVTRDEENAYVCRDGKLFVYNWNEDEEREANWDLVALTKTLQNLQYAGSVHSEYEEADFTGQEAESAEYAFNSGDEVSAWFWRIAQIPHTTKDWVSRSTYGDEGTRTYFRFQRDIEGGFFQLKVEPGMIDRSGRKVLEAEADWVDHLEYRGASVTVFFKNGDQTSFVRTGSTTFTNDGIEYALNK